MTLASTEESELKGRTQIVVQLYSFDAGIIVHEMNHALWHYANNCGLEMNFDSQEWQTIQLEYLFNRCKSKKNFTKIK